MPWSGASGSQTYSRTDGTRTGATVWQQAKAASVKVVAGGHDTHDQDIATALNAVLKKDGGNTATADLPMGGYKHTNIDNATARNQYAAVGQVQDGSFIWCGTAGGTANALTLTPTPAITAYATGMEFVFKAGSSASTSTVTISVSGLAAKAAEFDDAALSATSTIEAGKYYRALYDGTAFQLTRLSEARPVENVTGECRLVRTNATTLTLERFNGKKIFIDGSLVDIPSAGVTVDTTGLSTSTSYFVYAYVTSGTLTLEISATGHATDSTTGAEIKSGDATRTLVGQVRTNGSTQFVDTATQRFVRSWFNTKPIHMESAFTAQRTSTSNTLSELNSEIRCEFLLWADDVIACGTNGYMYNSTSDYALATTGIDGASTVVPAVGAVVFGTSGGAAGSFGTISGLSEGYHYATFLGANGNNSSTATYGISSAYFGRLSVAIIPAAGF